MDILKQVANNVIDLDINRIVIGILSIKSVQDFIIKLNTQSQLFEKGEDSLGVKLEDIGGGYSIFTIEEKKKKGQPTDRVTLFDEGDFYDSFSVKLGPDLFEIEADTIKEGDDLQDRWGDDILGLSDESKDVLFKIIKDEIIQVTREKIFRR